MKLDEYREASKRLYPELEKLMLAHGFSVGHLTASVDPEIGTVRLTMKLADLNMTDQQGNATTPEQTLWKKYAAAYDLDPSWLGKSYPAPQGMWFEIAGLRNTSGAKCVVLKRSDGRTFLTTAESVRTNLARVRVAMGDKAVAS